MISVVAELNGFVVMLACDDSTMGWPVADVASTVCVSASAAVDVVDSTLLTSSLLLTAKSSSRIARSSCVAWSSSSVSLATGDVIGAAESLTMVSVAFGRSTGT